MVLFLLAIFQDVEVVHRADTWEGLAEIAKPSATVERKLLLWCEPRGEGAWEFTMAGAFENPSDFPRGWYVLRPGDRLSPSAFSCELLVDRVSFPNTEPSDQGPFVERIGDLFKIGCPTPRSAMGNMPYEVVLAQRQSDGAWEILWHGTETDWWNCGGSHRASYNYTFVQREESIDVTYKQVDMLPYGDDDPDPSIEHMCRGTIAGGRIEWETPPQYTVRPGETWESVAHKASQYWPRTAETLKNRNRSLAGRELREGDRIVIFECDP